MLKIQLVVLTSLAVFSSAKLHDDKYRPQLHYSPPRGWINDPNGLLYHDGVFHLFFQHNPDDVVAGVIHWGHAISTDLFHWKTLPIAIHPEKGNSIFSGGAIVDSRNVTGLQRTNTSTLIAVFTAHSVATGNQEQWLAYSNDGPLYKRFNFYAKNPIVPNPNATILRDFRDPQVFQYKDHYVLVLVAFNRTQIYNSPNLTEWTLVSEFGEFDGSHKGVWECPSLFPINATVNGTQVEKWVLIISVGPDMQYFVGSFDGKTFRNDNSKTTELWVDYGPDTYAGITYNLLPDGRRIFVNWMSRWEYAQTLNFSNWNGQMGIPRELKLIPNEANQILLTSLPAREIELLRVKKLYSFKNVTIGSNSIFNVGSTGGRRDETRLLDVELSVDLSQFLRNDTLGIEFTNPREKLSISFTGSEFILNRTQAVRKDFNPKFGRVWTAPRLLNSTQLKLRIIVDRSAIEVYADDGLTVMAALYFSDEDLASNLNVFVKERSTVNLVELNVYQLKSIYAPAKPNIPPKMQRAK